MKLSEIYKIADSIAPKRLSDEYCAASGAYDNSGVLLDTGDEIVGVVCALDFTENAVDKAIALGANLLITHHPAIYGKIGDIRVEDPLGRKIIKCIQNGISVISMHLNLDCAADGIDESLMQGVRLASGAKKENEAFEILHKISQGGYGKAYDVAEITLGALVENINREFETERTLTYGDKDKKIRRVASFCGAGGDVESVDFAKANGADLFISSDVKHHILIYAKEMGLATVVLSHAAAETYGFKKYYKKIRQAIDLPCEWHADDLL